MRPLRIEAQPASAVTAKSASPAAANRLQAVRVRAGGESTPFAVMVSHAGITDFPFNCGRNQREPVDLQAALPSDFAIKQ
jgi:hypothetical protein